MIRKEFKVRLVATTLYYWDLLRKNLLCKCMELVFAIGQDLFRKLDFVKNGNLEKTILCKKTNFLQLWRHQFFLMLVPFKPIYIPRNCCEKTMLENMGYWQNGLENEKRYVTIRQRWVD